VVSNLELIEAYFNEELSAEKRVSLNKNYRRSGLCGRNCILSFFKQAAAAELEENRSSLKGYTRSTSRETLLKSEKWPIAKIVAVGGCSCCAGGIILGWYTFFQPVSPNELAR
jgi:hypothetical protein